MRSPREEKAAAPGELEPEAAAPNPEEAATMLVPALIVNAYPRFYHTQRLNAVPSFQWDATDSHELAEVRDLSGRTEGGAA